MLGVEGRVQREAEMGIFGENWPVTNARGEWLSGA
jgi:hypothetical protein